MKLLESTSAVHEGDHPVRGDIRHKVWIYGPDGMGCPAEIGGYLGIVEVNNDYEGHSYQCFQASSKEELIEKMTNSVYGLNWTLEEHASEDCWCHGDC